ncbi:hypothetical protein DFA_08361 [Cavenderia fasciculata]|uniref:Uncharacterized protein n=1 Tax=Cavenderia fasciculata TaxID=261658 RepID=F4Q5V7_CACFS|nr:uncharacterized protein DFA_08361 [Cavenderia fasciculata]EGG17366.1 hypothetical protein DFA_08361 [Cavenderia fasciculata]|eukprot:XP_004355850.1 hypothetical protein DFA_08361 [Cavenderia fasciculata]
MVYNKLNDSQQQQQDDKQKEKATEIYNQGVEFRLEKKDLSKAFDAFNKSAKLGHVKSQTIIGRYYMGKFNVERGVESYDRTQIDKFITKRGSIEKAVKWLTRARMQGDADAMVSLARLHLKGASRAIALKKFIPAPETARVWLLKAAELGHPQAMYYLARYAYHGIEGVNVDVHHLNRYKIPTNNNANQGQVFELLQSSSQLGNRKATYYYGVMCKSRGMPNEALESFVLASAAGIDIATIALANCHFTGYAGLPVDIDRAIGILGQCKGIVYGLLPFNLLRMRQLSNQSNPNIKDPEQQLQRDTKTLEFLRQGTRITSFAYFGCKRSVLNEHLVLDRMSVLLNDKLNYYSQSKMASYNNTSNPEYIFLHFPLLAMCYVHGYGGVEKDLDQALQYFQPTHISGIPNQYLCEIAKTYLQKNDPHSREKAIEVLEKAVSCQISEASYLMGLSVIMTNNSSLYTSELHRHLTTADELGHPLAYRLIFNPKDTPTNVAFEFIRVRAEQGNRSSFAQVDLGLCYRDGLGVERNLEMAEKWFTQSVQQANNQARYLLAKLLLDRNNNNNNTNNHDEMMNRIKKLLEESSNHYLFSNFELAKLEKDKDRKMILFKSVYKQCNFIDPFDTLYTYGTRNMFVDQAPIVMAECAMAIAMLYQSVHNDAEALVWFRRAKGITGGEREYQIAHYHGLLRNEAKQVKWLTKSIVVNPHHKQSRFKLAMIRYEQSKRPNLMDISTDQDVFELLVKSADDGFAEAQFLVAKFILDRAYVVNINKLDQKKQAIDYALGASDQFPEAYLLIAKMYYSGMGGAEQDFVKAFEWYIMSADRNNDGESYFMLGEYYRQGIEGATKIDVKRARDNYEKASNKQYTLANYQLAVMYKYGYGGVIDTKKAIDLLEQLLQQQQSLLNLHPLANYELGHALLYESCNDSNDIGLSTFERAIELINKANIALESVDIKYIDSKYFKFGRMKKQENDLVKAIQLYQEPAKKGHDHLDSLLDLGEIHHRLGNIQEALDCFERAFTVHQSKVASFGIYKIKKENVNRQDEAFEWLLKTAHLGDTDAMLLVGEYYDTVLVDPNQAMDWYKKASDQDNGRACNQIALKYHNGTGVVKQNRDIAFQFLTRAIDQCGEYSQATLVGEYYQHGFGNDSIINPTASLKYFKKSYKMNQDKEALYRAAMLLKSGGQDGIKIDLEQAYTYFQEVSDLPQSMYEIGMALFHGHGTKQSYQLAKEWLQEALENGIEKSSNPLQIIQQLQQQQNNQNNQVKLEKEKSSLKDDFENARNHFWECKTSKCTIDHLDNIKKSANQGHPESNKFLGDIYKFGLEKTPIDVEKAKKYYQEAALGGFADGMFMLAMVILEMGRDDAPPSMAINWIEKAMEKNHPEALVWIAECHRCGSYGFQQDLSKTVALYEKASRISICPQADLALFYLYVDGIGCQSDEYMAFQSLKKNETYQSDLGLIELGNCYFDGIGTITNDTEAMRLYQNVINKQDTTNINIGVGSQMGVAHAYNQIGRVYYFGSPNYPKDYAKAKQYFEKAQLLGYDSNLVQENIKNAKDKENQQQPKYQQQQKIFEFFDDFFQPSNNINRNNNNNNHRNNNNTTYTFFNDYPNIRTFNINKDDFSNFFKQQTNNNNSNRNNNNNNNHRQNASPNINDVFATFFSTTTTSTTTTTNNRNNNNNHHNTNDFFDALHEQLNLGNKNRNNNSNSKKK